MTKEQILYHAVREKVNNISILMDEGICSMDQIRLEHLNDVFPKLVPFKESTEHVKSPKEEDVETGLDLFHAIVYCPSMNIKLFQFVDKLLSNESSRTIIHAIVNVFRSKVVQDRTSITQLNMFYGVLAKTLDLQYGNILLATSTKAQLQSVIDNDWPFFTNNTDLVKGCLEGLGCNKLQDAIQNLSITLCNN